MFIQSFPYRYINYQHVTEPYNHICHNYSFVGQSKKRYIVLGEQFDSNVFAVKFYLAEHKFCKHKYRRLTELHECSRVITTVARIIKELSDKNPYASFVFIGANSLNEGKEDTKRFRLYSKIIAGLVSPVQFEHHYSKKYSSYFMINRYTEDKDLLKKIEERVKDLMID